MPRAWHRARTSAASIRSATGSIGAGGNSISNANSSGWTSVQPSRNRSRVRSEPDLGREIRFWLDNLAETSRSQITGDVRQSDRQGSGGRDGLASDFGCLDAFNGSRESVEPMSAGSSFKPERAIARSKRSVPGPLGSSDRRVANRSEPEPVQAIEPSRASRDSSSASMSIEIRGRSGGSSRAPRKSAIAPPQSAMPTSDPPGGLLEVGRGGQSSRSMTGPLDRVSPPPSIWSRAIIAARRIDGRGAGSGPLDGSPMGRRSRSGRYDRRNAGEDGSDVVRRLQERGNSGRSLRPIRPKASAEARTAHARVRPT